MPNFASRHHFMRASRCALVSFAWGSTEAGIVGGRRLGGRGAGQRGGEQSGGGDGGVQGVECLHALILSRTGPGVK